MKDSKKSHAERSNPLKEVRKTGGGDKGLPTARSHNVGDVAIVDKLGLAPSSAVKRNRADNDSVRHPPSAEIVAVSDLNVSILTGDDKDIYYLFEARGRTIVKPSKEVIEKRLQVLADLRHIGIMATSRNIKAEIGSSIDKATLDPSIIVATRVGFEKAPSPRYFVYGDGTVIAPNADLRVISLTEDKGHFMSAGDLRTYEEGLAKVLRNQSVPTTLFFFGLMSVLKPFVAGTGYKAENMMFELVGPTTTYKSALTCTLAGSAWGKGHGGDGYARSWNMSDQKIEDLFLEYDDHLLILDEATLADTDEKKRAVKILNTVHRMSSGQGRARSGMDAHSHSVTMLSTSNQPMRLILLETEEVRRALEVRLVSFQLPNEARSFFDTVPEGFSNVDDAMRHAFIVTGSNYGVLAREYIRNVLKLSMRDGSKLTALIQRSISKFLRTVGMDVGDTDAVSYRRVQPFALAYAAAVVAFKAGTLEKEQWGRVKNSIRRAWIRYGDTKPSIAGDPRIVSYLSAASNRFVDVRDGKKAWIHQDKLEQVAGYLFTAKDKALCLAVPAIARHNLNIPTAALKKLKRDGILRSGKNLQSKLILRRVGEKEIRDIFYVFKIPEIPTGTNLVRDPKNE
ncbi:DUF927 domain-containing protein [Rhizobium ruizarguesonis]